MTPRLFYQHRPSADRLGSAYHRHGALQPMEPERGGWLRRIWGARREQKGQRHG